MLNPKPATIRNLPTLDVVGCHCIYRPVVLFVKRDVVQGIHVGPGVCVSGRTEMKD